MGSVQAPDISQSIQAVNDILKTASKESIEAATKMVKVAAEMKVGPSPAGCGTEIDCFA